MGAPLVSAARCPRRPRPSVRPAWVGGRGSPPARSATPACGTRARGGAPARSGCPRCSSLRARGRAGGSPRPRTSPSPRGCCARPAQHPRRPARTFAAPAEGPGGSATRAFVRHTGGFRPAHRGHARDTAGTHGTLRARTGHRGHVPDSEATHGTLRARTGHCGHVSDSAGTHGALWARTGLRGHVPDTEGTHGTPRAPHWISQHPLAVLAAQGVDAQADDRDAEARVAGLGRCRGRRGGGRCGRRPAGGCRGGRARIVVVGRGRLG